jgi:hypothetical protein
MPMKPTLSDYDLYILPDNNADTLADAHEKISGGNAVLVFPDPKKRRSYFRSLWESKKYKACFIQNGQWLTENDAVKEISIGQRNFEDEGLVPTEHMPKYKDMLNMMLAKAKISIPAAGLLALPADILKHTLFTKVDAKSLAAFSQTSTLSDELVKPQTLTAKLLQHVARGQQDQAEAMLKDNPGLLFKKGAVTDYSNSEFTDISALQYAAWAYDTHMLKMLLKYVPNKQKEKAHKQLEELRSHYDFSPLITALQFFVDNFNVWYSNNQYEEIREYWYAVRVAQQMVPVHVANEYCREDRSFHPTPEFKESHLQRRLTFQKHLDPIPGTWFSSDADASFAVVRGNMPSELLAVNAVAWVNPHVGFGDLGEPEVDEIPSSWDTPKSGVTWGMAVIDLAAIKALRDVRMAELLEIKQQLKQSRGVKDQHPTSLGSNHRS